MKAPSSGQDINNSVNNQLMFWSTEEILNINKTLLFFFFFCQRQRSKCWPTWPTLHMTQ